MLTCQARSGDGHHAVCAGVGGRGAGHWLRYSRLCQARLTTLLTRTRRTLTHNHYVGWRGCFHVALGCRWSATNIQFTKVLSKVKTPPTLKNKNIMVKPYKHMQSRSRKKWPTVAARLMLIAVVCWHYITLSTVLEHTLSSTWHNASWCVDTTCLLCWNTHWALPGIMLAGVLTLHYMVYCVVTHTELYLA